MVDEQPKNEEVDTTTSQPQSPDQASEQPEEQANLGTQTPVNQEAASEEGTETEEEPS